MYIAVDFDGTIVENDFPRIGAPIPEAFQWLKRMKTEGGKLILWTCRQDEQLAKAIEFCEQHGLKFQFVNENPEVTQLSNKIFADVYIDDAAIGCPVHSKSGLINWTKVGPAVMRQIIEGNQKPNPGPLHSLWNIINPQPARAAIAVLVGVGIYFALHAFAVHVPVFGQTNENPMVENSGALISPPSAQSLALNPTSRSNREPWGR